MLKTRLSRILNAVQVSLLWGLRGSEHVVSHLETKFKMIEYLGWC